MAEENAGLYNQMTDYQPHKHFEQNNAGRDFVIGDLHGCFDILMTHLKALKFDNLKDRLFSTGDLVDRGPDSLDCLGLLTAHWFYAVKGNHEDFMIDSVVYKCEGSTSMWLHNGGMWATKVNDHNELHRLCLIAEQLPVAITVATENGPIGICHAEPPSLDWADAQAPDDRAVQRMLWARTRVQRQATTDVRNVTKVYCGHTPVDHPLELGNVEYIDTGCYHSSTLTIKQLN